MKKRSWEWVNLLYGTQVYMQIHCDKFVVFENVLKGCEAFNNNLTWCIYILKLLDFTSLLLFRILGAL